MPLALVIVVPVYYGRSANGTGAPLRSHGGSVRCCIPSSRSQSSTKRRRHRVLSTPSCGEIGNAVSIGGSWSSSFVPSRLRSDKLKRSHWLSLPHRDLSLVHSGHIGDCRGPDVWLAMPLRRQLLPSRSPFLGSRTPLPLLWACRPSNSTQERCCVYSFLDRDLRWSESSCRFSLSQLLFFPSLLHSSLSHFQLSRISLWKT